MMIAFSMGFSSVSCYTMGMRKHSVIQCILLAVCLISVLFGCTPSGSREGFIEEVDTTLSQVSSENSSFASFVAEAWESSGETREVLQVFQALGVSVDEITSALYGAYEYELGEAEVSGSEATVPVHICAHHIDDWSQAILDFLDSDEASQMLELDDDEFTSQMHDKVLGFVDELPMRDSDVVIDGTFSEGQWKLSAKSMLSALGLEYDEGSE